EKCLVRKHRTHRTRSVPHDELKEAKAGTARGAHARRQDFRDDRRDPPWLERPDRHDLRAVFVSQRKTQEQILDRDQSDAREIGRTLRTDTFEILQWCCEEIGYGCTTIAWPRE